MACRDAFKLLLALALVLGAWADEEHAHEGHSHGLSEADYEAALALGEDPCAQEALQSYDLALHIGAVFILLGVSLLGSLGPVGLWLAGRRGAQGEGAVATCIRLGTYFGFGTILSTALIHMMLPAAEALSNPCLPPLWNQQYEAWPYLLCTVAVLGMQLVDFLIRGYFRGRGDHGEESGIHGHVGSGGPAGCGHSAVVGAIVRRQRQGAAQDPEAADEADDGAPCPVHGPGCSSLLKHQPDAAQTVGLYLAEAGIIFHSVMIGLALGVASGASFTTLLVALSFHQFFEGFALGSAAVDAGLGAARAALMGLAYSVTTPVGIAIGIGVHEGFNANATGTLLATGILDAVSTGILIYVVLVQLITPMLTDSAWLHGARWWMKALAFAALYGGAATMAVIGKWA